MHKIRNSICTPANTYPLCA